MRNFYGKLCVPVITWIKKHLLKQVVPMIYAPEEKMFVSCFFSERKKIL